MRWIALVTFALGCGAESAPTPPAETTAQPVRIATVQREPVAAPVRATGVIAGKEEARLSFKIPGFVDQLLVDEGTAVTSGQLLATLKPEEASSRVTQARMR